ncbi:MAG TPA: response regulator [Terriglobia bacterium]|nr:response regulator [Terriglobia bacterium]
MDPILIVDDDVELCELLAERLTREGFDIEAVHEGVQGLNRALSGDHSIAVLDLMLPGMLGLDVLRRLRVRSNLPVLILTARGEDMDRILGLELGADDYLPKPFNPQELIARIRAILRRSSQQAVAQPRIRVDDVSLDPASREAWVGKRRINLTSVQYTLLEVLTREAGHIVARERLNELVLGRRLSPFDRSIDVHVSNLRKKLGDRPEGERIKAVRGTGYLFVGSKPGPE